MKIKIYQDQCHLDLPLYPITLSVKFEQEPIKQSSGSAFHQIFIVADGNGILKANDTVYRLEKGDMFFLPAHQPHEYRGNKQFKTSFMGFGGGEPLFRYFSLSGAAVYRGCVSSQLTAAFQDFYDVFSGLEESLLCAQSFSLAMRFFRDALRAESSPLDRVCNYMEENFAENVMLEELLKVYSGSKSKLCRDFKNRYGMTVFEKLTEMRLEHAHFLLRNQPEMKVKNVAEKCGYHDESYFCRMFRRKYGYAPGTVRKQ